MSYQVLARKWRPRSFAEMVGQEHVLRALINALDSNRLHHAFLFTGTRGVGKTTLARLLAKAINCEQGVSSRPCGECSACREIDEGRFVDLIEVDAASRTKVEDTRELLDNVQYAPGRGRYKVYLIDEVHMLSNHSFNALLKTLEEPPPHIKFLLATTDPQKLPVTILSRCLQFNLKRLGVPQIREQLERIVTQEGVAAEPGALQALAQAADGSMRDGISLLDQAIAHGGGGLTAAEVREMLGTIDRQRIFGLLGTLARGDAAGLGQELELLAELAPDYTGVLNDLNSTLGQIALAQVLPGALSATDDEQAVVSELAQLLTPEDVQLYYQIGILGRRDLPLAPEPRLGFEMVLLRMLAFRPAAAVPVPPRGPRVVETAQAATAGNDKALPAPAAATSPIPEPAASAVASVAAPADWEALVERLPLAAWTRQLALNCILLCQADDEVELVLDPEQANLHSKKREEALAAALGEHYGRPVRVNIQLGPTSGATPMALRQQRQQQRQVAARQALEDDAQVQDILKRFDARVEPDSIEPID